MSLAGLQLKTSGGTDRKWIPRIVAAIETLESDPRPVGCKKLVGSDLRSTNEIVKVLEYKPAPPSPKQASIDLENVGTDG